LFEKGMIGYFMDRYTNDSYLFERNRKYYFLFEKGMIGYFMDR